jgi:hypothetical protein
MDAGWLQGISYHTALVACANYRLRFGHGSVACANYRLRFEHGLCLCGEALVQRHECQ